MAKYVVSLDRQVLHGGLLERDLPVRVRALPDADPERGCGCVCVLCARRQPSGTADSVAGE